MLSRMFVSKKVVLRVNPIVPLGYEVSQVFARLFSGAYGPSVVLSPELLKT